MSADILTITDQEAAATDFLHRCRRQPPLFACTIATTETAAIPGISAAGANVELIRYTAAADVEAIYHGRAKCLPAVPENPVGPPSPVIITMAAIDLLQCPALVIDAGNHVIPEVPMLTAGRQPGGSILDPLPVENARELFVQGLLIGAQLGALGRTLILAESVPGGTTTAMSLMEVLGVDARGRISGSMPGNNPSQKAALIDRALAEKGLVAGSLADSPLQAVALLGDPMQAVQAGVAIAAGRQIPVLLGGGTQMLAVAVLIGRLLNRPDIADLDAHDRRLAARDIAACRPGNLGIATTAWVSEDRHADIRGIARQLPVAVPMFAARMDFRTARHENLRLYEEGYVKEGVGAGAMGLAAMLYHGIDNNALLPAIEAVYERIYRPGSA
ncbi:MAG: TIGR00303 family protein [Deltaproteobacteria bacterium]|nr:TIGR00303 family protein [Candidatus Anaeroferrophillacea bacterium]